MSKVHILSLEGRNKLTVSGVNEILSATEEQILLYTVCGNLKIKGDGLTLVSAFSDGDRLQIEGHFTLFSYDDNKEKAVDNFITRIFR